MPTRRSKTVTWRYFDAWQRQDADQLREVVHKDVVDHSPYITEGQGIEAMLRALEIWHRGFPGFLVTIDEIIAEDDRVATRWNFRGTHSGPVRGHQPTGKEVFFTAVSVHHITDGQITDDWLIANMDKLNAIIDSGLPIEGL